MRVLDAGIGRFSAEVEIDATRRRYVMPGRHLAKSIAASRQVLERDAGDEADQAGESEAKEDAVRSRFGESDAP